MKSSLSCLHAALAIAFAVLIETAALAQPAFVLRNTNADGGTLRAYATGGGMMIAAGDRGAILSSIDGKTWTRRTSGTTETLRAAAFGAGRFVAVGDNGTILRSENGSEWTPATSTGTQDHFYAVTFGRGRFVAVGNFGVVIISSDGDNWTEGHRFTLTPLRAVLYDGGEFVATGEGGLVYGSYDGTTWGNRYSSTTGNLQALGYGPDGFVAVGDSGQLQFGGMDGFTWTSYGYKTGTSVSLHGVCGGANLTTAVGDGGTVLVSRSMDTWTPQTVATAASFQAIGFANDTFISVGEHETILQSTPVYSHALRNISVRSEVGAGERSLIAGFAIRGTAAKRLLIRGAGPALAAFGVDAPLLHPTLTLYDGTGAPLGTNAGWSTASNADDLRTAAKQAGAFAFPEGSNDTALLATLAPGIYTAVIAVSGSETGVALVECYDLDSPTNSQSRLTNLSARAYLGAAGGGVLPGFFVSGNSRLLLVRAVGPSLANFGIKSAVTGAKFRVIYPGSTTVLIGGTSTTPPTPGKWYLNWNAVPDSANAFTSDDTREAAAHVGAFPLVEQSQDAAALMSLSGAFINPYSVEVQSSDGSQGIVLIELYDATDP